MDHSAIAVKSALDKLWIVGKAVAWAILGGGVGALADAIDDLMVYEGPLDFIHLRKVFAAGAIMGLIGWWRKEVALGTPVAAPVPTPVPAEPAPAPVAPVAVAAVAVASAPPAPGPKDGPDA